MGTKMRFDLLRDQPADPLLKIIAAYAADLRSDKIDLGVGVFRDDRGETRVLEAVKRAEQRLLDRQTSKAYLGPDGDKAFVAELGARVFGADFMRPWQGLQTPGGTGALRLAAEILVQAGVERIWLAAPSWANHAPIFAQAGLRAMAVDAFDVAAQRFDAEAWMDALRAAAPGDAVLLHGCCHNPMGIDPDPAQWRAIADVVAERDLLPLVDLAYQGLGDGWDEDAAGARLVLGRSRYGLLAYSCDKNFGLYRERVGALWATAPNAAAGAVVQSNLLALARANWSMPPDHGAATVRIILEDPELAALWQDEREAMRRRLHALRGELGAQGRIGDLDLAPIATGKGLFATLPLAPGPIEYLRREHGIYMAGSGRINIAGFGIGGIERFCDALHAVVDADVAA
ncbi:amino acid aminotransferase [Sphingomonas abietis]|uniref:Aromatic amino acid transaminase n=1 Tax=Sphingomonas abietis TaxID=3012344 RepID=A0ABY7NJG1_9SPHN|nr:aromatic amino acid transaminase [Sphingomonas abietis]WBO20773.1 aromatic amino acid transaminase [Sphingomonas abietis]